MAVVNGAMVDITADTLLSQSKSKLKGNDDDLLENDIAIEARVTTAEGKVTALEGGGFVGTARWDDLIISGLALVGGASAPDLTTFIGDVKLYTFDGGSTLEEAMGTFEVPHDYKEGTDLRPHIHWAPIDANAGDVHWQMSFTKASRDGVFPAQTTITCTSTAGGVALAHKANECTVISGVGVKIGDIIAFRLFRDPANVADTYGSDAFLLSIGIHYQIDSTGSVNVFTKT